MSFHIINGPNLNLLGRRNPELYGKITFESYLETLRGHFWDRTLEYYQSNHEGDLIDILHELGFSSEGIVLNPGGYGHTSIALRDAIEAITTPVVEVHITDINVREDFRRVSMIADVCAGQIKGRGLEGYRDAIDILIALKGG